jgi:3-oxoacyl-[acyl-carrier-protein] synthase-3
MPVYLAGARYVLGERESDYTSIGDLAAKVAELKMADNPQLWGWGKVYRTSRPLEELAIETGRASLAEAGIDAAGIDAVVLCCTWMPASANDHGAFVQTLLRGIGLGDIPVYGQSFNRCVNLLTGIDVANAMAESGRYRRILVITTDRIFDESERLVSYAIFSDGAASCVVTTDEPADGFVIRGCATAQQTDSLESSKEISSDLAREVNEELLAPLEMKIGDLAALMHSNIFKPLLIMKERQAGFTAEQLRPEHIARFGHCFAADPLINLVERPVNPDQFCLLASSVPGSRVGVLLQKLAPVGRS